MEERLVEAVREYSCLWQIQSRSYKDTRAKAWKAVALRAQSQCQSLDLKYCNLIDLSICYLFLIISFTYDYPIAISIGHQVKCCQDFKSLLLPHLQ